MKRVAGRHRSHQITYDIGAAIDLERFESSGLLFGRAQTEPTEQRRDIEFPFRRSERAFERDRKLRVGTISAFAAISAESVN